MLCSPLLLYYPCSGNIAYYVTPCCYKQYFSVGVNQLWPKNVFIILGKVQNRIHKMLLFAKSTSIPRSSLIMNPRGYAVTGFTDSKNVFPEKMRNVTCNKIVCTWALLTKSAWKQTAHSRTHKHPNKSRSDSLIRKEKVGQLCHVHLGPFVLDMDLKPDQRM